jgi:hypothetical protein
MSPPPLLHRVARAGAIGLLQVGWLAAAMAQDSIVPTAEAWLAGQPKEDYDLAALEAKISTPGEAFEYVRDRIAPEPYSGVMKGAAGALLTHGANDCDRALLLASLLSTQGLEVKLVRGAATPATADGSAANADATALLLRDLPPAGPPPPAPTLEQKSIRQIFAQRTADRAAEIRLATSAQETMLAPALPAFTRRRPHPSTARVWVQAVIDGKTVDLDPAQPGAKLGSAPTAAVETWAPEALPDEIYQTMTLRVVSETLAGGALERKELLSHSSRTADLLAHGFRLAIIPSRNARDGQTDFRSLLLSGDDLTEGEMIRLQGTPAAAPEPAGAGGLLGGFDSGPAEPPPQAGQVDPRAPRLARLWVEIVLHAPGLPDNEFRRTVLDRAAPAPGGWKLEPDLADDRLAARLLLQTWDCALDVGTPHPFAFMQAQLAALQNLDPLRTALAAGHQPAAGDLSSPVVSPQLLGYFLASGLKRHQLAEAAKAGVGSYLTRPRLAFLRHGDVVSDWTTPSAPPRYVEGIDLVNAPFEFTGPDRDAARVALEAGIADTVLEQFVLNRPGGANTVPLFAAMHDQNLPLVTLRDRTDLGKIKVPAAIRAALERELAAGHVLVAPDRPVAIDARHRFGWWNLDPATGYIVGQMDLGGAQNLTEAEEINQKVAEWTEEYVKFLGNVLKCYQHALEDSLGSVKVNAGNLSVDVTVNHGDNPMPGGEAVVTCLRNAACDALKDFITNELNSAAVYQEAKTLEELIGRWVEQKAISKAGGAGEEACQQALGGG